MCPMLRLLCTRLLCPMCRIGDMLDMGGTGTGTGNSMLACCPPLLHANCMTPCNVRNHTGSRM